MATRCDAMVIEGETARAWINQMNRYRSGDKVISAVCIPYDFVVVQDGDAEITGKLYAKAGCWLALSEAGTLYPIPSAVFAKMYTEVGYVRAS